LDHSIQKIFFPGLGILFNAYIGFGRNIHKCFGCEWKFMLNKLHRIWQRLSVQSKLLLTLFAILFISSAITLSAEIFSSVTTFLAFIGSMILLALFFLAMKLYFDDRDEQNERDESNAGESLGAWWRNRMQ
jgi:hypothetical protein